MANREIICSSGCRDAFFTSEMLAFNYRVDKSDPTEYLAWVLVSKIVYGYDMGTKA